jgi:curved DNA-binding protein
MPVPYQDYYEILGVPRSASHQEIQRAYRKLARQYHPDINKAKDAEERFKKVNEAYQVLGDEEQRKKYDAIGSSATPPPFEAGGYQEHRFTGDEGADFSDFFRTYFGRAVQGETPGGGVRRRRGRDLELELEVTLAEALHGGMKSIEVEFLEPGPDGSLARNRRSLEVRIPPGITDGTVLRMPGEGGKGSGGGGNGDLYLLLHLKRDPRFEVEEHDVLSTVDVAPWEAALGGKVKVATIDGSVNMTLPPGTSSGHIMRLKGKGLPRPDGSPGDQLVTVRIVVPPTLSETERRLFTELSEQSGFKARG